MEDNSKDREIFFDPSLTMGERIMNHKFARMDIWEFLGWRPGKKPKKKKKDK